MKPTLIDLFAGCGGLSLGLERAGFEPVFVNELHPDAMRTYLQNRSESELSKPQNHVHDILSLTQDENELDAFARRLRGKYGEIDLVAGGPPCQGFSGIGHRRSFDVSKAEIPSNHLYREMAKLVTKVAPKAFLFENVRGLLNSRWTPDGSKGEIWNDVIQTFEGIEVKVGRSSERYDIGHRLVFAKDFGVPQNRPRVLLVGFRTDLNVPTNEELAGRGLLPIGDLAPPDIRTLLGDLVDPDWQPGGRTECYPSDPSTDVQRSLRQLPDGRILGANAEINDHEYSKHSERVREKFAYMLRHEGQIPPEMKTKKFAQRLLPPEWGPKGPTITATSLPDDYVHFSQPRTLTVREWARLQTFPDWYSFFGKRTTGGRRRAGDPTAGNWSRDLPKYTQIGNAVPVELASQVGRHILKVMAEHSVVDVERSIAA